MKCPRCHSDVSNDSIYCNFCGMNLINPGIDDTQEEITKNIIDNSIGSFKPGELFGDRYKIISELGRGGMGRVFKAEDRILGTTIALKIIRPEYITNQMMIRRFKKEILLAREITHENVVRIFDFGEINNIKFISMEYIGGENLKDIINNSEKLSIEKILNIAIEICKGLSAAHKRGIIHRDLKPQNIMIGRNGHVYITDFGLAKSITGESISQTGIVIGTPQYIAPEQWRGEKIGPETDIYTLGIIIYEMLTKHSLFDSESDLGYLQKHLNEKPSFKKEELAGIPVFLRKVVLKCLEKEKRFRYRNCGEIIEELKKKSYKKDSLFTSIRKLDFNFKKTAPVLMALVLMTFTFLYKFNSNYNSSRITKKRSIAVMYFNNLTGSKNYDYLKYSFSDLLITDVAQSKFIRVLPENKLLKIFGKRYGSDEISSDPDYIKKLKNEGNVNYVVTGSFNRSGKKLRVTIKLMDSGTGELLDSNSVETDPDNIFAAVDRITRQLKKSLNFSDNELYEDIDPDIENITTSSQKALKYYIEGKRLFNNGDYEASLIPLKKSVKEDPGFAMGYRMIAWSYAYQYNWEEREKYFKETIKHVKKLSEKERLKIMGDYYGENPKTFGKSIDSYKKLLEIYPEDSDANFQLGLIYRMIGEYKKAVEKQKIVLQVDRSNINAFEELITSLGSMGRFDEIKKEIDVFELDFGDIYKAEIIKQKYRLYLSTGKNDLASEMVDELNDLENGKNIVYSKLKLYICQNNFKAAKKELKKLKNIKGKRLLLSTPVDEIYLLLTLGKFNEAIGILKNAINNPDIFVDDRVEYNIYLLNLYYRSDMIKDLENEINKRDIISLTNQDCYIYLWKVYELLLNFDKGNMEKAKILLKDIRKYYKKDLIFNFERILVEYLSAKYEDIKGHTSKAEEHYLKAIGMLPVPFGGGGHDTSNLAAFYYFDLAKFYFRHQDFEKARNWFDKTINLKYSKIYNGDLYARSYYYLGKIYQYKDWKGMALKSFREFYSLWKDGDPEITDKYLSDTKKQINILLN